MLLRLLSGLRIRTYMYVLYNALMIDLQGSGVSVFGCSDQLDSSLSFVNTRKPHLDFIILPNATWCRARAVQPQNLATFRHEFISIIERARTDILTKPFTELCKPGVAP